MSEMVELMRVNVPDVVRIPPPSPRPITEMVELVMVKGPEFWIPSLELPEMVELVTVSGAL